jgi:hypothetical protein
MAWAGRCEVHTIWPHLTVIFTLWWPYLTVNFTVQLPGSSITLGAVTTQEHACVRSAFGLNRIVVGC